MGEYKTSDPAKYDAIISSAHFKTYTVRCRAKVDTYKDQTRVRVTAAGIASINYKEECMRLVSP
jgi:replication factor A1